MKSAHLPYYSTTVSFHRGNIFFPQEIGFELFCRHNLGLLLSKCYLICLIINPAHKQA